MFCIQKWALLRKKADLAVVGSVGEYLDDDDFEAGPA